MLPFLIAGGVLAIVAAVKSSKDKVIEDSPELDRAIPTAKAQLTKNINKLQKKLQEVQSLRNKIGSSDDVVGGLMTINKAIDFYKEEIFYEKKILNELSGAIYSIENVNHNHDKHRGGCADVFSEDFAETPCKKINLGSAALEPDIEIIANALRRNLVDVHDFYKAIKKIKNILNEIEDDIKNISVKMEFIAANGRLDVLNSEAVFVMADYLYYILEFHSLSYFSKNGNLKKTRSSKKLIKIK